MISSRRWSGFLRRLAVCVDEKCRLYEEGTAALLADYGLGGVAGRTPGINSSSAGPVCIIDPVEPVLRACHSSKRLILDQDEKRKTQNAGCKISKKAGGLTSKGNRCTTPRLAPKPTIPRENPSLSVGYLQALVGGLPTHHKVDEPASGFQSLVPLT